MINFQSCLLAVDYKQFSELEKTKAQWTTFLYFKHLLAITTFFVLEKMQVYYIFIKNYIAHVQQQ